MLLTNNCPYCNKISIQCEDLYECDNHLPVEVTWSIEDRFVGISHNNYNITFYTYYNKYMQLSCDYIGLEIFDIPYDKNLTPENFEQKIKTYLNFQ
jgi:hypothetical protein